MDLKDLEGLKDGIGDLMKNVKEEDIDKIKELVKDGVDTDKLKELLKDGVENADELKEKVEAIADKLPDMDEIKDTLGKLDGLKGLFGGKKD